MDHVEMLGGLARLVGLKMADQVPPKIEVGRGPDFLQCLLNLVLTEIQLAALGGDADALNIECFGHGDESNG